MTGDPSGASTGCASYGPGHLLHWMQWKKASGDRTLTVQHVIQTGTEVELVVPGQPSLRWYHHDPEGLRRALEHRVTPILAAPRWQALRVDGHWFNCAAHGAAFTLCP